jgi:hypothetical protein
MHLNMPLYLWTYICAYCCLYYLSIYQYYITLFTLLTSCLPYSYHAVCKLSNCSAYRTGTSFDVGDASPSMSYRDLRRNRGISRIVTDIAQLLGMVANIISLLIGDEADSSSSSSVENKDVNRLSNKSTTSSTGVPATLTHSNTTSFTSINSELCLVDNTTVLCASAMLSLSKVKQGKQSFVTHGSMALVSRWLKESRFILADAHNQGVQLPEDHLIFKLITSICGILVAMASTEHSEGEQDYSIGWTDSNLIAMGMFALT